jgi:diguanylate cyclase (GGDEF)-like protein/PAS domain S-box-containing protein
VHRLLPSDRFGTPLLDRLRGRERALVVLLAGVAVLAVDLVFTILQGGRFDDLVERTVVLLFAVPAITWYLLGRSARSHEQREHERHERQESLLRNISDLIFEVDRDGTIRYQSPSVERAIGYAPDDLVGTAIDTLVSGTDGPKIVELLASLGAGGRAHLECQIRQRDGQFLAVDVEIATQSRDREPLDALVLTVHDVSKWKELEEQLTRQAFHDPLTGLPNRALYADRLDHAIGRRRRHAKRIGVLFLDLDDFKTVNDSLGHGAGDSLIRDVAARLSDSIRPGDTAARLGGDEFAILLEDVDEGQAVVVAMRILVALEAPFDLGDRSLLVGASIGIAVSSDTLETASDMLRAADIAMYDAKDAGKGQYRIFQPAMHQASTEKLRLGADLRGAVERGELAVHYQPIVDLPSGEVASMEALVRWMHPEQGVISPVDFIPRAEKSGLIVPIGVYVVREACRQARTWQQERRGRTVGISVNVSGVQLRDPGFVAAVSLALEDAQLEPALLTLEITESVMAIDDEAVGRRLRQLKGLGVRLAIDDFGTGYSSLGSIGRFPVDEVKIDKAFVDALVGGGQGAILIRSIIRLAHSLKLTTVAEGVELDEQSRKLIASHCDQAQGYLFSRPLDARQAGAYLMGHTTITLWAGYSGQELAVMEAIVADFETRNPGVKVDVVGGMDDDRIIKALRDGNAPNIVSSFDSGKFGAYLSAGGLVDLQPYLERDGFDDGIFTEAARNYTRHGGRRWALPMLADAYGLYYNREMLAKVGLSGPPRTMAELADYAKRLTTRRADGSLEVVGFNPLFGFYENEVSHLGHQFGGRWFNEAGDSMLVDDPAWAKLLRWQKELVDWYGYDALVQFGKEVGEEFSSENAFETGRLALCLDGEWRIAFIGANGSPVKFGTAPFPTDDAHPELYGSGFINGTIIGMPAGSSQPDVAWDLIKYLTTNDAALVKLSNGLRNIPSTYGALHSPDLVRDSDLGVFLDIFAHPKSSTPVITAAGTGYEDALSEFAGRWQAGQVRDLGRGLREVDRQINTKLRRAARKAPEARRSGDLVSPWQLAGGTASGVRPVLLS